MHATLWRMSSAVPGQPHLVWFALKAPIGIRVAVTEEAKGRLLVWVPLE